MSAVGNVYGVVGVCCTKLVSRAVGGSEQECVSREMCAYVNGSIHMYV